MLRLSVIVVVGPGHEDNLFHCLEMLTRQSHPPHEVCVISDGAHRSEFVYQHYRTRLPLHYHHRPNDARVAYSRNLGARLATGEYLVFIDCDMLLNPDALAAYAEHFRTHPNTYITGYMGYINSFVAPSAFLPERQVNYLDVRFIDYTPTHLQPTPYLAHYPQWYTLGANFGLPAALFHQIGGQNELFQGWGGEDLEFGERLRRQGAHFALSVGVWGEHQIHQKTGRYYQLSGHKLQQLQLHHLPQPQATLILNYANRQPIMPLIFAHYLPNSNPEQLASSCFPVTPQHINLGHDQYAQAIANMLPHKTLPPPPWKSIAFTGQQANTDTNITPISTEHKGMSVIVSTGMGRSDNLYYCLEMLCQQTYPADEIIVISDGEPHSEFICQAFAERLPLRHHYRPNDLRVGYSRNLGVSLSNGEQLIFLDTDVMLNPEALALYAQRLEATPQACLIGYCGLDKSFESPSALITGRQVNSRDPRYASLSPTDLAPQTALRDYPHWYVWTANFAIHRTLYEKVGGFQERICGWGTEDLDFANRLYSLGTKFVYLLEVWGEHQVHPETGWFYDFNHGGSSIQLLNEARPHQCQIVVEGPTSKRLLHLLNHVYNEGSPVPFYHSNFPQQIAHLLGPTDLTAPTPALTK